MVRESLKYYENIYFIGEPSWSEESLKYYENNYFIRALSLSE
jgi:hypothetical protein